ncbi:MAG TPA: lysophospholipid acyltransferase family protein [Vicinamibacterales bacterium]
MTEPDWRASRVKRLEAAAIAALGTPIIAALARTWHWQEDGTAHLDAVLASRRQPILALWHGRILPATVYFRDRGVVAMTSQNFDGEWIARIMRRFGYAAARGSTSRGARQALLQLRRDMAGGRPAAFTVDGPRGPARKAQPGAVFLAKITGNPILPFHIEARPCWTARSWDATQVPKPWSRVAIAMGEPLWVPADADAARLEGHRVELERRLQALEARTLEMLEG